MKLTQSTETDLDVPSTLTELRHELYRRALLLSQDRQRADDLVQATIERALIAGRAFPSRASLRAWLKVVLRNLFIDERRHAALDTDLQVDLPSRERDELLTPIDLLFGEDVHRALGALPPKQAEIIALAYVERRSHREIADRLGIPARTVATRIFRGKARLRAALHTDYLGRLRELAAAAAARGHSRLPFEP